MNTLGYAWQIFLKDVRVLRIHIALLIALGLGLIFFMMHPNMPDAGKAGSIFVFLFCLMELAVAILVIQADPAGREFRFMLTRPVPGPAIGLAKALFLTLFLFAPGLVTQEFVLVHLGVPLTAPDHILFIIETLASWGAVVAVLLLFCVFFRKPSVVAVTVVVVYLAAALLTSWWRQRSYNSPVFPHIPTMDEEQLGRFQTFLSQLLFTVTSLVAIGWRYKTKGFGAPLAIAVGGLALSLVATRCPWNFAQSLYDHTEASAMLTPEQLGNIHMTLVPPHQYAPSYHIEGGGWNNIDYDNLNQEVRLEGVQLPYYVQIIGYRAVITLKSGKTFVSNYSDFPAHSEAGGIGFTQMATVAGVQPFPLPDHVAEEEQTLDLATYVPANFGGDDVSGATIKGVLTLEVRRAYVAGSMPARLGASFAGRRSRYMVLGIKHDGDRLGVSLEHATVPLALRGDVVKSGSPDDPRILPVYRPYNEELDQTSVGYSQSSSGTLGMHESDLQFSFGGSFPEGMLGAAGWQPLPDKWRGDVEIVFMGSERCGVVELPYEIDNVDLAPEGVQGAKKR